MSDTCTFPWGEACVNSCVLGRKVVDDVLALVGGLDSCVLLALNSQEVVELGDE